MAIEFKPIPNLVQGVSQQAAQQRRDSQCEAQYDCINSPKNGAVARPGADLIKMHSLDLSGCFSYELFRGLTEHYLVTIKGGAVRVFDLNTGDLCTVNIEASVPKVGSVITYLSNDGGAPQDAYAVQTVDDFTFIASKHVAPAMAATLSSTRPKEALVFFKAGAYSMTYGIAITYAGAVTRLYYTTPDNSVASNAPFIMTGQLAATFYRALTTAATAPANNYGYGAVYTGASPGASFDMRTVGFGIEINGNVLRIYRTDNADFQIDTVDGAGDEYMSVIKDTVRSFSELPKQGFEGFTVKVHGVKGDAADDYYVEYVNKTAASGSWQERVAPGVETTLDQNTMPHALVNTSPGVFEFRRLTWSTRIAGDGEDTARDPGFIGKNIEDLFFHQGRLAILTEATCDWSKARNVFTHFPDTAQTVLADAPIGITLSAARTIALLRRAAMVDESLYLWAQGVQFRVHSNNDPFRQDTIEAPPSTAFEFAERANFAPVGTSLYFATEPEDYVTVRNLTFSQGRAQGDTDVTAHVSELIPAGVRRLSVSDTGQMLFVQTDGAENRLYLYNYLVQDRQIVQSAWNEWRLPEGTILWSSVWRMNLYAAIQRGSELVLVKVPLDTRKSDPGGEYLTRLDLRVTEAACSVVYDPVTERSTITLPYAISTDEVGLMRVAIRTGGDAGVRGRSYPVLSGTTTTITVQGDITGAEFYAGLRIDSRRRESTFYIRGSEGLVPTDRLSVRKFEVFHDKTGYYRIEIDQGAGRTKEAEYSGVTLGVSNSVLGSPPQLGKGALYIACDTLNEALTIDIINDSFLPSAWQTAVYHYEATYRAKPSRVPSS